YSDFLLIFRHLFKRHCLMHPADEVLSMRHLPEVGAGGGRTYVLPEVLPFRAFCDPRRAVSHAQSVLDARILLTRLLEFRTYLLNHRRLAVLHGNLSAQVAGIFKSVWH